jgi:hypothetical protein
VFAHDPVWRAPAAKQAHIDAAHHTVRLFLGRSRLLVCRSLEPPPWCRSPRQRQALLRSLRTRCSPHKMTVKAYTVAVPRARRARVYQRSRQSSAQVLHPNHLWRRVRGKDLRRRHNFGRMGILQLGSGARSRMLIECVGTSSTAARLGLGSWNDLRRRRAALGAPW